MPVKAHNFPNQEEFLFGIFNFTNQLFNFKEIAEQE